MDKVTATTFNFETWDETIHQHAANILLGSCESEFILTQGNYSYQVSGGSDGYLNYSKLGGKWISIANWCFYGLYIVVRYRKPQWLRPMYQHLFTKMNFTSVKFSEYSIGLTTSDGQIMSSRRFRLSPPKAFEKVMSEEFGYSQEKIKPLKTQLGFD